MFESRRYLELSEAGRILSIGASALCKQSHAPTTEYAYGNVHH